MQPSRLSAGALNGRILATSLCPELMDSLVTEPNVLASARE